MAKETATRIFLIVMALIFLVGSIGFTIALLFQKDDNQIVTNETQQQAPESSAGKQLANYTPLESVETLQKVDLSEGSGAEAKAESTVTVHYTGALATTGVIFESSLDVGQPITFPLNQVIKGWGDGVPGMKVGGKRRLIIPAALAYGEAGAPPTIPPNTPLVFDIELLRIE